MTAIDQAADRRTSKPSHSARAARRGSRATVRGMAWAWLAALALSLGPALSYAAPPTRPATRRPTQPPTARPPTAPADPTGAGAAAPGAAGEPGQPTGTELTGDEGGGFNFCRKQPRGAKFRITLPEEAELKDLVNWMMTVSCQKFIWDPKVRGGKVTILSPEPVTIEEAYAAFYASLETMGLTVEPSGEYFKIVEAQNAANKTLPVYGPGRQAPTNDRYVTQLMRVAGGNTQDIVQVLEKLKTKGGSVEVVGDLIILTDTGSSVRRLKRIVSELDDPAISQEKIFFFQLQYADPEETAEMIREIFGEKQAQQQARQPRRRNARNQAAQAATAQDEASFSRVVVDERTGTLIIVASEQDYQVIRRLIERLDVALAGGGGRIHVVKLKNADPEEVAQVLQQLGTGAKAGQQGAAGRRQQQQQQQAQGGEAAELFSGEIKVTADPATRSLVILASNADFKALKTVIEELDMPRRQVYIEVYLLELTVSNEIGGGAGAHFGSTFNTDQGDGLGFVASAPTAEKNSVLLSPSILSGLAAGVLGPQVPNSAALLGTPTDIPAFGVVIQALQERSDVNFVAEPHLYTADNQEASIEVGRNVPTQGALTFPGGGQGGGLVPVQSVQRQDVTLNVKLTPHVNDEETVTLDIELENNDIESISETLGVTTTKRRLKLDKVLAYSDKPLVLGGLVQEVERISSSQVPGLGDIPLLGWLFKSKTRTTQKVNLMMILVPHILETPDDVRRIHTRRIKERLEFLERYTGFQRRDLDTHVNYRKKAGLLVSINKEAERMLQEDEFRRQADLELQQQVITGELGLSPRFEEDQAVDDQEPAASGTATPPTSVPSGAAGRQPRRPRER